MNGWTVHTHTTRPIDRWDTCRYQFIFNLHHFEVLFVEFLQGQMFMAEVGGGTLWGHYFRFNILEDQICLVLSWL
jgi:hypothetical protein